MKIFSSFLGVFLSFAAMGMSLSIETISDPDGDSPSTAINNLGTKAATWIGFENNQTVVKAALRTSLWSVSATLSDTSHFANNAQIRVNDQDEALVLWQQHDGSHFLLQASLYSGGIWGSPQDFQGSWSAPMTISDPMADISEFDFAFNNSGDAIAVWTELGPDTYIVYASIYTSGAWSQPVALSNASFDTATPVVALNDSGMAVAGWIQYTNKRNLVKARIYSGGSWGTDRTVSAGTEDAYLLKPVINSSGKMMLIWEKTSSSNEVVTSTSTGGNWSNAQSISTSESAGTPDIALNDLGEAIAVWQEFDGVNIVPAGAVHTLGVWRAPFILSSNSVLSSSRVVAASAGLLSGTIAWIDNDGSNDILNVAALTSLPLVGGILPPLTLQQHVIVPGQSFWNIKLAFNSLGNFSLVGNYFDGTDYVIGSIE